jgi:hypothetical protein
MYSLSFIGRHALDSFVRAMVQYKAHWYTIILPKNPTASDDLHHLVFLSLLKLMSIEEDMMQVILAHCKLVQY